MRTKGRVWQAALVLGVLAAYSSVRAADLKYLPADTEIVFTVNVKQILDSELFKANKEALDHAKTLLDNAAGNNPAQQYLKKAGFDVFRDLHSLTFANSGSKDPAAGFIIIEGKFNPDKFTITAEEAARDSADTIKITKSGGQTIYEITPPGERMLYATLLEGKVLLAAGNKDALLEAVGRAAGTKRATRKKEFTGLLGTVNNKQSINFVATGAALAKLSEGAPVPNGEAATAALQGIEGLSGAITITKEVQFQLGVNAKDEAGAKKMAQDGTGMLLGVQFLIGQQAKKDEKFAPVVDIVKTLRITNEGSHVLLRGVVSLDVIEKLMKNIPQ